MILCEEDELDLATDEKDMKAEQHRDTNAQERGSPSRQIFQRRNLQRSIVSETAAVYIYTKAPDQDPNSTQHQTKRHRKIDSFAVALVLQVH